MGSKKDKKDRKHKSEKKSKKDSKSSKKKSSKDKKHKSSKQDPAESELATILNTAVFTNPKLMTEIPLIVKSLDDGEYIDVYSITKKFTREIVAQLMKHLPVLYDPAHGFYKDSINTNVSEYVVRELTKQQIVKAPNDLSMSEALASKNVVHKLVELLMNFPDLKGELGGLFGTIIDGHSVQLDSLDNEDIRDGLEDLFRAIGMENSADGFTLPEGRRSDLVREALEHLNNTFSAFNATEKKRLKAEERAERGESSGVERDPESEKSGSSSSSGSDSEDSQHSDNEKDDQHDSFYPSDSRPSGAEAEIIGPAGPPEAPAAAGPVKGPSMPTLSDLHSARALIEQQRRAGVHHPSTHADESSSDDEGFGPQLCDTQTARVLQAQMSAVPLGFTGAEVDPAFERAFEAENAGVNSRLRGEIYTGEAHKVEDETKREEWILNPGDSKLAACKSLLSASSLFNLCGCELARLSASRSIALHLSSEF